MQIATKVRSYIHRYWRAPSDFFIAVSLIPYGGGTSVVGGVEVPTESHKVISVDMRHFDRLLEVDKECLTVRVQAGVKGTFMEPKTLCAVPKQDCF